MGEGGGKDRRRAGGGKDTRRAYNRRELYDYELKPELIQNRRRAVTCAVEIFFEEKGMIIGGIEVGRYNSLTRAALDRELGLNGGLTAFTFQVDNIQGNHDTLSATLVLAEEEA